MWLGCMTLKNCIDISLWVDNLLEAAEAVAWQVLPSLYSAFLAARDLS